MEEIGRVYRQDSSEMEKLIGDLANAGWSTIRTGMRQDIFRHGEKNQVAGEIGVERIIAYDKELQKYFVKYDSH